MQQTTLRVHLVDNDYLVRLGMERLLETMDGIELQYVSSTGNDAIKAALMHRPDVILMETMVQHVDGVQAVREIVTRAPDIRVAMVSSAMDLDLICDAYRAGATSYLSKYSVTTDLGAAIRMIHQGDSIFSLPPDLSRFPLPVKQSRSIEVDLIKGLPSRDHAILTALTAGRTNLQIGAALRLSEGTVKARIAKIMLKLNVEGRVQLAVLAVQAGLAAH
ncbi:response regulator [Arthrobacter sp. CP30]